jgi:hypothetical protein
VQEAFQSFRQKALIIEVKLRISEQITAKAPYAPENYKTKLSRLINLSSGFLVCCFCWAGDHGVVAI